MLEANEFLQKILEKREISGVEQIEVFLNPDYEKGVNDPFLFPQMELACKRLYKAISEEEKIIIYADYDCDGIPGAVILSDLLDKIEYKNFIVYIPERNSEGFGLNKEAVSVFAKGGTKLIITVDLGTNATEEVDLANSLGIDVIITDHHLPSENLPKAYAILNPKISKGKKEYPNKMLCGAGVVFKFVQGFLEKYCEEFDVVEGWEKWLLDMAGLGTLSDMVPLVGENRIFAHYGLLVMRKSPRPGLQKLLSKMNIDQRYLTEDDVGFMIAPRINAASRMDSPMRAFELLATKDEVEAGSLANHLSEINDHRKHMVLNVMKQVKKNFESRDSLVENNVIVMGNPSWQVGILGIVASKIMDQYDKPVFVWGKDDNDIIKGSCRSPGSVSLVELMSHTEEYFLEYGGHELAGGFSVHNEKIHFLYP